MKIAVIGGNGQLGSDVCLEFERNGDEVIALNHDRLDITKEEHVIEVLEELSPDMVVNTAAYHNVEKCEEDPDLSYQINARGAQNVARACAEQNAYFVHISTDYVFDGYKGKPYVEFDEPEPLNVYGKSKLAGEEMVTAANENALVMRVSGLYGKNPCRAKGLNFVDLMQKLGSERDEVRVVDDEIITPTSTVEVARQLVALSRKPVSGVCHGTAEGGCSWHEFASEIFRIKNLKATLNVAAPGEFPIKVPRPSYSVLENRKLKDNQVNTFKHWKDGLAEYLS